jgi:hypothetical protein
MSFPKYCLLHKKQNEIQINNIFLTPVLPSQSALIDEHGCLEIDSPGHLRP